MSASRIAAAIPLAMSLVLISASASDEPRPPDLAGTWTWSWKDAQGVTHRHVLEVESAGGKLTAQERRDDLEPVKVADLKRTGDRITFSVLRGETRAAYDGKLSDPNTINGDVMVTPANNQVEKFGWTAQRKPVKTTEPARPRRPDPRPSPGG